MSTKQYIGDGVYVDVENGMLKLTTENGIDTTNTIYLEPEVWAALVAYTNRPRRTAQQEQELEIMRSRGEI